jgi:hypothetical protein
MQLAFEGFFSLFLWADVYFLQALFKERLSELEETNKNLVAQVLQFF